MKHPLRVLVLMHEDLVPPRALGEIQDGDEQPWRTEYDVLWALDTLGHEARALGVHDDLGLIREAIGEFEPDITFNVLEEFHGVTVYGQAVIAFLELMRQATTGCNPRGLLLAHDKVLTKKILAYHRIPTPRAFVVPVERKVAVPKRLEFPLIVKSTFEDASLGISQASVVHNHDKLVERVQFMHERFGTDVLVEEYIDGRELYVGLIGNARVETFPVWEMKFNRWSDNAPRIATEKVKWDYRYQKEHDIQTEAAGDLNPATARAVARVSKQVYRSLGLSGYARIDLRLRADGRLYVIEANANPDLAHDEDFARSAGAAGYGYPDLIQKILNLGLAWRPQWKDASEA